MYTPSDFYTYFVVWSLDDKLFVATCAELPGVAAQGETAQDALREVHRAAQGSIESIVAAQQPIPAPAKFAEFAKYSVSA